MGDRLKQVGKKIGTTQQDIELLKRRGGLLPSVERTRGLITPTISLIAPFGVNEQSRKLALSLNFYEHSIGGGCEFGNIDEFVQCELSWGVPYPYGSDVGEAKFWFGPADYPPDGFNFGNPTQGPQNFVTNTGEFSLEAGGVHSTKAGFYLITHHFAPGGVTLAGTAGFAAGIKVNGVLKSQRVYSVANGALNPPLSSTSIHPSAEEIAVVEIKLASDLITFHLTTTGIAFFTEPNFAGQPPHTTILLVGNPS